MSEIEKDTNFIEQLDFIFKGKYGDDFQWDKAVINKKKGIVEITYKETAMERFIREIEYPELYYAKIEKKQLKKE